jgi:LysM repeat protein
MLYRNKGIHLSSVPKDGRICCCHMKLEIQSLAGKFFVLALIPVFFGSGCKSSNQASASLPASTPAAYPSNLAATPAEGSIFAADENKIVDLTGPDKPSAPKPKPFVLREGETLASHKVTSGDNLSKLASKYGTSISRIQAANNLTGTVIITGKTYKIPTKKSEAEIAESLAAAPSKPAKPESITINKPTSSFASEPASSLPPKMSESPADNTFTTPRTFTPPPANSRPTFTPRSFDDYNGPTITNEQPSTTAPEETSSLPSPTFGSGAF